MAISGHCKTSRGFIDSSTTGTVMTDICTELGRAPGVPAISGEMVMVSGVRTVVSVQPAPASGSTGTIMAGTLLISPSSAVSTPSDHQDYYSINYSSIITATLHC